MSLPEEEDGGGGEGREGVTGDFEDSSAAELKRDTFSATEDDVVDVVVVVVDGGGADDVDGGVVVVVVVAIKFGFTAVEGVVLDVS